MFVSIFAQATFYPGLCEPTSQGGLGFDYYVNLSVPDMWSTFLESVPDHEWNMTKVYLNLSFLHQMKCFGWSCSLLNSIISWLLLLLL